MDSLLRNRRDYGEDGSLQSELEDLNYKYQKDEKMRRRRRRMTARNENDELLREIVAIEKRLAQDEELESWAEELADEEAEIVTENVDSDVAEFVKESESDLTEQNEKANKNWPIEDTVASRKARIAKTLIRIAKDLYSL